MKKQKDLFYRTIYTNPIKATDMLINLIKHSLRSFKRQRAYIIINVLGLSIGIACSLLIALYVINEASYDKFNTKKDRIFRAILNGKIGGKEVTIATSPAIMGPTMLREFPEVEDYCRMTRKGPSVIEYKNQAFTDEQRTKEIGVRKAMGSSVAGIYVVISREIVILVSISALIACPLIYYIAEKWLQNFFYRINLGVFSFIAGLTIALGIALITISYRILKTANINPAQSLKYE